MEADQILRMIGTRCGGDGSKRATQSTAVMGVGETVTDGWSVRVGDGS
jgi:hypothetical protein